MSKELDAMFSSLLQEISEQEKKLPESTPASEHAQRRAEKIAQAVEDDGSWQIPPEQPKPVPRAPYHPPVVVPEPVSHFSEEPSANPAIRMRDRLEEGALPKPDAERKPNQILPSDAVPDQKRRKRRRHDPGITDVRKQIQGRPSADMKDGTPVPEETKRKSFHINIPDELPPDIPRDIPGQKLPEDLDDLLAAAAAKKAPAADPLKDHEAKVRSRAEQIREQMRQRAEESAQEPAVKARPSMDMPVPRSFKVTIPDDTPAQPAVPESKPSFFSKVKGFMNDFLDLNDDDEEERPAAAHDAPPDTIPEEAHPEPEKKALHLPFLSQKPKAEKPAAAPEAPGQPEQPQKAEAPRKQDAPKKAETPSILSRLHPKKAETPRPERPRRPRDPSAGTDWRTLVAAPAPVVPDNPSLLREDGDDLFDDDLYEKNPAAEAAAPETAPEAPAAPETDQLAEAYDELEQAETILPEEPEPPAIPSEIIALLQPGRPRAPKPEAAPAAADPAAMESRRTFSAADFLKDDPDDFLNAIPEPAPEAPVQEKPAPEPPVHEAPVQEKSTPEPPVHEAPVQEKPAPEPPIHEAPVQEKPAPEPPIHETPVQEKPAPRERRLRNLASFDEDDDADEEDADSHPAPPPPPVRRPEPLPEVEKKPGRFSSFREALDESAEELAEMKAEPLPDQTAAHTQFLKRHWYFLAGILCFLLALVGLIATVGWCVNKTKSFFGSSTIKESLEAALYPAAVVDLPAFETPSELQAEPLLSAAMVDILMYDDLTDYPVTFDVISIPANVVLSRAQERFGTDFTTEFTTLHAAGETFYYDSASGCYNVPASPSIFSYSPEVTDIARSGDTYTVAVRFVSDKASWQERSVNFKDENSKVMQATLQKEGDSYRILRLASTSEEAH